MKKDYREALQWYRRASDQGFAGAQFEMGTMYAQGFGTAQNSAEAVRLMHLAARSGYKPAQHYLICASPEAQRAVEKLITTDLRLVAGAWLIKTGFKKMFQILEINASPPKVQFVSNSMESTNPIQFGCSAVLKSEMSVSVDAPALRRIPLEAATYRFDQEYVITGIHDKYEVFLNNHEPWGSIRIRVPDNQR